MQEQDEDAGRVRVGRGGGGRCQRLFGAFRRVGPEGKCPGTERSAGPGPKEHAAALRGQHHERGHGPWRDYRRSGQVEKGWAACKCKC